MIVGVSAGVGKSTFAKKLGNALNIDVYHLDSMYWKPGWVEASFEEFSSKQKEIVNRDLWIIEGNYSNSFDIRLERADTVIYLELPLLVCLYRVLKRWIANIGKTRPDMGEGCKEKIDWDFIQFICATYDSRKQKLKKQFQAIQSLGVKKIVQLKSKKEIEAFLDHIKYEAH